MTDKELPALPDAEASAYIEDLTAIEAGSQAPTIKRMTYRHHRLLDFMIRNPHMKLGEIADHLNYSQAWVSIIINSDLFKAAYQARRNSFEMVDHTVLSDKITKLANLGLDGMIETLERTPDLEAGDEGPSFNQFKAASELALKAAGYLSPKESKGTTVNVQAVVQTNAVSPDVLAKAREMMIPPSGGAIIEGAVSDD